VRAYDNQEAIDRITKKGYNARTTLIKDLESDSIRDAVEVDVRNLSSMQACVREIEALGKYEWQLYNADLAPEQMYLFEHDLNPLAYVEYVEDDGLITSIKKVGDCMDPDLKVARISIASEYNPLINYGCRITRIDIDEHTIIGSEVDILGRFKQLFDMKDPDIILVKDGDRYGVEHLQYRIRKNKLDFYLGRVKTDFVRREGKSYISYGRVIRRDPSHYLKGRIHVDDRGFNYVEADLEGLYELARMTKMPIQKSARLSPGASITNIYTYTAWKKGYPIPYKRNMVEDFKTVGNLLESDKGGLIYEPETGFHTDVAEIDFVSLYPNIMVEYNISPETMLCNCCQGKNTVPDTGHHICEKRRGLVPQVLEPVIKRRMYLKHMFKKTGEKRYKKMSNGLKWMLVTSFGYMGYRRSRYGRIEGHESITAYARDILRKSAFIAEENGFEVVHGIVDSLWVKKKGLCQKDVEDLCTRIEKEVRIPLEIEGLYKWIVFNPSVNNRIAPTPNRYYGVFLDGTVKARGIDVRRSDTPEFIKEFQARVLQELSGARSLSEFRKKMQSAYRILRDYEQQVLSGNVEYTDLALTKRVSQSIDEYKGVTAQRIVLEKLAMAGINKQPGEKIRYVIRNIGSRNPYERYMPVDASKDARYDKLKYIELLENALENLFVTQGVSSEEIHEVIRWGVQARL